MKITKYIIILVYALAIISCEKFEYSPYQTETTANIPTNLNNINLNKLLSNESNSDDTVTIIYSGDSQRFYTGLKKLVAKTNTIPNIDFFILSGDIVDFGLMQEYLWIYESLSKLNVPYLCAIGNHDLVTDKGEIFTNVFGEKNYSFIYKGYKFIFHDTNGIEYDFNGQVPNLGWLKDQLADPDPSWFVGVSHVPPYNDAFDKKLEIPYKDLLASSKNFIVSLHAHLHGVTDSFYYNDSVRYMTSNSVDKSEVVLLKFIDGKIIKQMITYQ